jgi:hypothetical protein
MVGRVPYGANPLRPQRPACRIAVSLFDAPGFGASENDHYLAGQ